MDAAKINTKIPLIFIGLVSVFATMACTAGKPTKSPNGITNYTSCSIPKDQGTGSLLGAWGTKSIPIVFDQDFYLTDSGETVSALRNAVLTWNAWATLKGFQIFRIINDGSGIAAGAHIPVNTPSTSTPCLQSYYTTESALRGYVGVWKIQASGDGKNTRDTCSSVGGTKILDDGIQGSTDWITSGGKIVGASILLNFDAWNAPGKVRVDLESLLLHELGHVAGLLHSCNGGGGDATTSVNCGSAPASYISAVMFPALLSSQIRRTLMQNDYNRINCLY